MPTLEDLANLDHGLVLISGARRSGKTLACAMILRRWRERGVAYRHFAMQRPDGESVRNYAGRATEDNVQAKCIGLNEPHILIDEPIGLAHEVLPLFGINVIATSDILPWMAQAATWVCYTSAPSTVTIYPGPALATSVSGFPQPQTIWERLLSDTA